MRSSGSLCASVLLFAFAAHAVAQNSPPAPPNLKKIKDDLYLIENSDVTPEALRYWGGNITVFVADKGVVLIDAKYARAHDDVVAKLKSITDKPLKYVILTHNHPDHAEGAPLLEAMGAEVIISDADRDNMARSANAAWLPGLTFAGQARLFLGGKELQLYQFRGHTRGDTVVYFPAYRLIVLGDMLTTNPLQPPTVNYADGGSWTDWTNSIDEILKMDFDMAIPGHGPMVTKAQVLEIRNRYVAFQQRIRALNRAHKSPEEIAAVLKQEFNWSQPNNLPGFLSELR